MVTRRNLDNERKAWVRLMEHIVSLPPLPE
jgi:hypothetical protein